ncbi:hypothetical protein DBT_2125 [Dissulfuribacter thermophilus]|uniref:Uncharacterized protein n=1 Tax=Dissulfuribacter thermophilus TaxID=1156395 RepID=A0A1B9F404_9BACT|nr:hypothetical protein DBT_2125 [Dissulfuribacter thermophilus]
MNALAKAVGFGNTSLPLNGPMLKLGSKSVNRIGPQRYVA